MSKQLIVDQVHVTFFLPEDAPNEYANAASSALDHQDFLDSLQNAVRSVLDSDLVLATLGMNVER
jgi:hypothetical protein